MDYADPGPSFSRRHLTPKLRLAVWVRHSRPPAFVVQKGPPRCGSLSRQTNLWPANLADTARAGGFVRRPEGVAPGRGRLGYSPGRGRVRRGSGNATRCRTAGTVGRLDHCIFRHKFWTAQPTGIRIVFSHRTLLPTPRDFPAMTSIQNSMNTRTFAAR